MNATWTRFGCGLLVVALSVAGVDCGKDSNNAKDAGSDSGTGGKSGTSGKGASAGSGGTSGKAGGGGNGGASGKAGSGGKGGNGGAGASCSSLGMLPTACVSCVQSVVSGCGSECVALLNCVADKCGAASDQTTCVTMCCLTEATTAVGAPGGRDVLGAAQKAEQMECAAMCGKGDADGGS